MPQLAREMIRGLLICLLSLLLWAPLSAQEKAPQRIEEILIVGNQRVPDESIWFRISFKAGDLLDSAGVTRDLHTLWETGLFEDAGIAIEEGKEGGVILKYVLRELPLVTEVDYRGYRKMTKSSITDKVEEERLTIPEDSPLDYRKINAIRALIKKLMNERGLRFGTVDYKLENLDKGSARVVFNLNEGSKVRIYDIEFDGNQLFTDGKLRRTMRKTKEHWMFSWLTSNDIYKEESFEKDVERLKKRYWRQGYKDVVIGEPVLEVTDHTTERQKAKNLKRAAKNKPIREKKKLKLTIPVFEGEPYTLARMEVEDNTVLPSIFYERSFPIQQGEIYDLHRINEWITELEETHNNAGYVHYSIRQEVNIEDGNQVAVRFMVNENDQTYIHRIKFSGNTTTRDKVLRREILLREGDVFRVNFFRNSLLRINQLGFFDVTRDEPDLKFLPDENKINITIKGQESGVNELNFGLGFSEFRGTSGFLSFSTLNFLGKGEKLKIQAQIGSITDTFDVTFTEPWLFDKPRGLTTRVFNTRSEFSASGFNVESTGFQLGLSFRPTVFSTYSISYLFSEDRFPTVINPDFKAVDDLLTSSITQSFVYNTTDHPFFPKKGRKMSISLELASWQAGGDNFFYKIRGSATQYLPAIKNTFIGLNLEAALFDTLQGQRPARHQLFYIGGEESVRGYERQSLGPASVVNGQVFAERGDKLVQANAEYIIPVSDQFRFVMFFDAGMVFGVDQEWFDTDLFRSTGIEMRFSLPVFQAPLRLIYAWKLDEDENGLNEKGGEPSFSIGTTF
ncbi:outer membrane protein assembly factor BamA [Acanthopleuribacter pedis]|uniref:Outer membrane protein assembly factor BamA n=1 Tax=Acanthopleuribacter pedis TaxID=442870 RepID=A0A8J7QM40_9BACT|nr:outer membrane protein assembly factor BamA [Acanthopleuribacter pedis]MBO1320500.1 outer membrane protein assembly factor BamA [Acanthopleuribacter pedis]